MRRTLIEIAGYWGTERIAPTAEELAVRMGRTNASTVREMLLRLERRGLVHRIANKPRTLRLTETGETEACVSV